MGRGASARAPHAESRADVVTSVATRSVAGPPLHRAHVRARESSAAIASSCPTWENTRCSNRHWNAQTTSSYSLVISPPAPVSLCVSCRCALLGLGLSFSATAACHAFDRGCMRVLQGMHGALTDCCFCVCVFFVFLCGWGASVIRIGEAAAVALAKALETGHCQLKRLFIHGESMRVLPHALLGLGLSFLAVAAMRLVGGVCVAGGGVDGALMLTDCVCTAVFSTCG